MRRFLDAQSLHVARQVSKIILHLPIEPADIAHLTLDVLAQRAKRLKLRATSRVAARAAVHLIFVRRAREVLVERVERTGLAVAQEALVHAPVPRALRSPRRNGSRPALAVRNHGGWIRDDVLSVVLRSDPVNLVARDTRRTRSRFPVRNECGSVDEHLVALLPRALHGRMLMDLGAEVLLQVVVVLEETATGTAVVMYITPVVV